MGRGGRFVPAPGKRILGGRFWGRAPSGGSLLGLARLCIDFRPSHSGIDALLEEEHIGAQVAVQSVCEHNQMDLLLFPPRPLPARPGPAATSVRAVRRFGAVTASRPEPSYVVPSWELWFIPQRRGVFDLEMYGAGKDASGLRGVVLGSESALLEVADAPRLGSLRLAADDGYHGAEIQRLLVARQQDLVVHGRRRREDDLRGDLDDPGHGLALVPRPAPKAPVLAAAVAGGLADVVGHYQVAVPDGAGLEHGLELGHAIAAGVLELFKRIEGRRVGGDGEGVGAVDEGGAQGDGRRVLDAQVQEFGRRQDGVGRGLVRHRVAHHLANLDAADLVEEQHRRSSVGAVARSRAGRRRRCAPNTAGATTGQRASHRMHRDTAASVGPRVRMPSRWRAAGAREAQDKKRGDIISPSWTGAEGDGCCCCCCCCCCYLCVVLRDIGAQQAGGHWRLGLARPAVPDFDNSKAGWETRIGLGEWPTGSIARMGQMGPDTPEPPKGSLFLSWPHLASLRLPGWGRRRRRRRGSLGRGDEE